jgi:hypothetical protein
MRQSKIICADYQPEPPPPPPPPPDEPPPLEPDDDPGATPDEDIDDVSELPKSRPKLRELNPPEP